VRCHSPYAREIHHHRKGKQLRTTVSFEQDSKVRFTAVRYNTSKGIKMKRIIGSKFNSIFRCLDMLCFNLGNDVQDDEGDVIPEYRFHIQTSWRFVKGKEILLASRDVFLPHDESLNNGYYDYEEQSTQKEITATSSIFDVAMHDFEKHFENATVKSFDISPLGDLRIDFTNGVYFETFTPSVRKCEEWRFLPPGEEDHLVIFDV